MLDKKRAFDLFCASLVLIVATPFFVIAYPLFIFLIGRPIIFKQKRLGQKEQEFVMYKMRSMNKNAQKNKNKYLKQNEAPAPMFKIASDPRFIRKKIHLPFSKKVWLLEVGRYLSQSGLDELPQFFNILKGEMSLFGPRPLPVEEALLLKKIDPAWYRWRHSVKPGIFSAWALDSQHNKSFTYWKKLEKETLAMSLSQQLTTIWKIIIKQLKRALF
jgi:lipopolysaccharide/colanic/teichoic acid biosynthesis glycosyltransferase